VALRPGSHVLGPAAGSVSVRTYRDGLAQRVGHDLVFAVRRWEAAVEVDAGGRCTAAQLRADPESLDLIDSFNGVKPLTGRDREQIGRIVSSKVLRGLPITFASQDVGSAENRLAVSGELSVTGATRPVSFELELHESGRVRGTLPIEQSKWGIKPYSALMGALKVRDAVDVVLDVRLPAST
jgi:hypothetical protein